MAVNKIVNSTNMAIEIQTSVDKAGDPVFTKKTFPMSETMLMLKLYMM